MLPPIATQPIAGSQSASDDYAIKVAEVSVLRSRLQQFERENARLQSELAQAKEQGSTTEANKKAKTELERLNNELTYAKQDLRNSEDQRQKLQSSLRSLQAGFGDGQIPHRQGDAPKLQAPAAQPVPAPAAAPAPAPMSAMAPAPVPAVAQPQPQVPPVTAVQATLEPLGASAIPPVGALHAVQSPAAGVPRAPVRVSSSPPTPGSGSAGTKATPATLPSASAPVVAPVAAKNNWRQEVLLRELACWEASSQSSSSDNGASSAPACRSLPSTWFALREAVNQLGPLVQARPAADPFGVRGDTGDIPTTTEDVAMSATMLLQVAVEGRSWPAARAGARFIRVWMGLLPNAGGELVSRSRRLADASAAPRVPLFDTLVNALHAVVLDQAGKPTCEDLTVGNVDNGQEQRACAAQVLDTLVEIAGKLRPQDLVHLGETLRQPSLCALLGAPPRKDSLHLPCLHLLHALLQSPELFALAHQADSGENVLLASANLLLIPSAGADADTVEKQQCRVAALELFCRCLATAPRLDIVLQLRGAPTVNGESVDTVLQRVVLLCHHELMCLGIHGFEGGPWHNVALRERALLRLRAADLALSVLSSFMWQVGAPLAAELDAPAAKMRDIASACAALDRTRPLVASIVDLIARGVTRSPPHYARLLSSASVLRVLVPHADGEDNSDDQKCFEPVCGGVVAENAPMVVDD